MISVVITTLNSERPLARTLAALVPGAVDGLVSEAIVADGGSRDSTAIVADAAGCIFIGGAEPLGPRLKSAAATARAPFLLFVRPGIALDMAWVAEARRFTERSAADRHAAVFRRGVPTQSVLRELGRCWQARSAPCPAPGKACSFRAFYAELGGHAGKAADRNATSSAASAGSAS